KTKDKTTGSKKDSKDDTKDAKQALKDALKALQANKKSYIQDLLELLKDDDPSVRLLAAKRLGSAGKGDKAVLAALVALAGNMDADRDLKYVAKTAVDTLNTAAVPP